MSSVRLGVALSGGSFFGIAHIGVLQALEASGIRPDVVTGASAGALVAGLYAARVPLEEAARFAQQIGRRPLRTLGVDLGGVFLSLFGRPLLGLCTGDPLLRRVRSLTKDPLLADLPQRSAAPSTTSAGTRCASTRADPRKECARMDGSQTCCGHRSPSQESFSPCASLTEVSSWTGASPMTCPQDSAEDSGQTS